MGLLPAAAFMELLIPKADESKIISKWELDLDCTIEGFLWNKVSKKANLIFDSYLRDFHIQFLKRAFHYNQKISTYQVSQSPMCDFCNLHEESYKHLFWECVYVVPIWTAIQDMCYDAIDMEDFSMFKCLLSNFNSPLICVITALVKRYIHCCKHTGNSPCVSGCLINYIIRNVFHVKMLLIILNFGIF